jgi:hypothetical protein
VVTSGCLALAFLGPKGSIKVRHGKVVRRCWRDGTGRQWRDWGKEERSVGPHEENEHGPYEFGEREENEWAAEK